MMGATTVIRSVVFSSPPRHSFDLLYFGCRFVVMAVGVVIIRLVVSLADVLVNVSLKLPTQSVLTAGRRGDVLQRYGLSSDRRRRIRLASRTTTAIVDDHNGSPGVGPVMMVPAVQLPVPFSAVGLPPHPALDGH